MTETKEEKPKKKLSLSRPGKLELKKTVEGGQVRQSFSHGRSKVVTVEVRKKRTFAPGDKGRMKEVRPDEEPAEEPVVEEVEEKAEEPAPAPEPEEKRRGVSAGRLTDEEKAARARALQDARKAEEERRNRPAPEPEPEEPAVDTAAEEERRRAEEEARRVAEEEERLRQEKGRVAAEAGMAKLKALEKDGEPAAEEEEDEAKRAAKRGRGAPKKAPAPVRRGEPRRRAGKLTIAEALDDSERTRSLASVRRAREKNRQRDLSGERVKIVREVVIPETITVQELANRMAERSVEVVKALMKAGVMASVHQVIDGDTAELIVAEFGHKVKRVSAADVEIGMFGAEDTETDLKSRPPVVTVMGHVDHGKTSLLDAIRQTDVASSEAGGITQHIGAYEITLRGGGKITFIDTPGHEAFTSMRSRGAKVTDIVILVVAADDGIMPQTVEAIAHAKAAEVPIIVAINKIDRPDADPNRVRTQLLEHELVCEALGGDILDVEVSAKEKINLDKLEEAILLQAEILDLKANPNRPAEGTIVESRVETGRGSLATVLVQRGTLKVGDTFVAGAEWGRVRALINDRGERIEAAGPSVPVEVVGLNGTPQAGDEFVVVENESRAREISEFRQSKDRAARTALAPRGTLEEMFDAIKAGEAKELPLVIKGDVQGSVEAINGMLDQLPQDEVKVNVLHEGVGGINESDISLAGASGAVVIGFNVRANRQAKEAAEAAGIDIRYYSVIYDVIDDVKKVLVGLMAPTIREEFLGNAQVREVFNVSKVGRVAGCYVTDGVVRRGAKVRLLRDDVVIHEGSLSTLKRFKEDVREVKENYECGMSFENYQDIKEGDVIECYDVQEVAPEI